LVVLKDGQSKANTAWYFENPLCGGNHRFSFLTILPPQLTPTIGARICELHVIGGIEVFIRGIPRYLPLPSNIAIIKSINAMISNP
jgi:hypothetical protein